TATTSGHGKAKFIRTMTFTETKATVPVTIQDDPLVIEQDEDVFDLHSYDNYLVCTKHLLNENTAISGTIDDIIAQKSYQADYKLDNSTLEDLEFDAFCKAEYIYVVAASLTESDTMKNKL